MRRLQDGSRTRASEQVQSRSPDGGNKGGTKRAAKAYFDLILVPCRTYASSSLSAGLVDSGRWLWTASTTELKSSCSDCFVRAHPMRAGCKGPGSGRVSSVDSPNSIAALAKTGRHAAENFLLQQEPGHASSGRVHQAAGSQAGRDQVGCESVQRTMRASIRQGS